MYAYKLVCAMGFRKTQNPGFSENPKPWVFLKKPMGFLCTIFPSKFVEIFHKNSTFLAILLRFWGKKYDWPKLVINLNRILVTAMAVSNNGNLRYFCGFLCDLFQELLLHTKKPNPNPKPRFFASKTQNPGFWKYWVFAHTNANRMQTACKLCANSIVKQLYSLL